MSAARDLRNDLELNPGTGSQENVVYLLLPPNPAPATTPAQLPGLTLAERVAVWQFKTVHSKPAKQVATWADNVTTLLGVAMLLCIGLYALYFCKSMVGINLLPDQKIEDYVPVKGYGRR